MTRKNPSPVPDAQPAGSGASEGTDAPLISEVPDEQTFGERLKAGVAGEQVQRGVNDGLTPDMGDLEPTEADTELAEAAEEPMVTYHGQFGKREITKENWEQAGVQGMPTVEWLRHSGFKVPLDVFTPQALQVLRQDPDFKIPSL